MRIIDAHAHAFPESISGMRVDLSVWSSITGTVPVKCIRNDSISGFSFEYLIENIPSGSYLVSALAYPGNNLSSTPEYTGYYGAEFYRWWREFDRYYTF